MKFFKFNLEAWQHITQHHSNFFSNPFVQINSESKIALIHLKEDGLIGYHQVAVPQLLIVLDGEGYIRGGESDFSKISVGEAVLWTVGEWHETTSEHGMLALVIESKDLSNDQILFGNKFGLHH